MLNTRNKIIAAVIALGLILIALFKFGLGSAPVPVVDNQPALSNPAPDNGEPALVSSDPPQLFEKKQLIFRPDQVIKLTFNRTLQNGPETKLIFDPPVEVDVKLSDDFKTAIITPKKAYKLGQGYTLFIKSDTKLQENGKTLGKEYDLHFNVINYSGI